MTKIGQRNEIDESINSKIVVLQHLHVKMGRYFYLLTDLSFLWERNKSNFAYIILLDGRLP